MRLEDLEKKKKSNNEIIESLIKDTKDNKFKWYRNQDELFYARRRKIVKTKYGETILDIIFRIYEQEIGHDDYYDEYSNFSWEYQQLMKEKLITLDILITKNGKKEILCRKMTNYQHNLKTLIKEIIKVYNEKPKMKLKIGDTVVYLGGEFKIIDEKDGNYTIQGIPNKNIQYSRIKYKDLVIP